MELIVVIGLTILFILILKWVGAWMLGVTNVLDAQQKSLTEMKKVMY